MKYPVDGWPNEALSWMDAGREAEGRERNGRLVRGTIVIIDQQPSGRLGFGMQIDTGEELDLSLFDTWRFIDADAQ